MPAHSGSVVFAINGTKHTINVYGVDVSPSTTLYDYLRQRTTCTVWPGWPMLYLCCLPRNALKQRQSFVKRVMKCISLKLADETSSPLTQGTKLGCGEGGCGACSVEVYTQDTETGNAASPLAWAADCTNRPCCTGSTSVCFNVCHPAAHADSVKVTCINSCLAPIGTMDGSSIITVEGLGDCTKGFHPVQGTPCSHAATWTQGQHAAQANPHVICA